ncbi:MAG: glycosyltransferase family 9 protein [Desulfovibrio sp.]|jgi:ADP-heptose:LPS heptosyltransferase|nr:glycosyltransferase family 9 protein [Desulfovibrio sp.]
MNTLLINLTRFGDLLQTQAAVSDLARQGRRVGVVCLENFAAAAGLLDHVEHLFPLPGAGLLAALERRRFAPPVSARAVPENRGPSPAGERPGWTGALADLAAWKERLRAVFPPERVCNLTATLPARLLARFLAGNVPCDGFALDEHGFSRNGGDWAAFLQGASAFRGMSPFNIADVFRRVAAASRGPGDPSLKRPDGDLQERVARRLREEAPAGGKGFVALQLGASEERRRWPAASFAALGRRLWEEERLCPLLVGSPQEVPLAREYLSLAGHPALSLCGQTSPEELAAALCAVRLLVTNDTGTMHLASGLDRPVLGIFLATAQPFDTGPYRAGSCSLEPDLPCHPCPFGRDCPHDLACRQAVSPALAADLALAFLRRGHWPAVLPRGRGRVWLSFPAADGFLDLRSLSGHEGEDRVLWLRLLRQCLSQFLDGEEKEDPVAPEPPLPLSPAFRAGVLADLERARDLLLLLRQQGKMLLEGSPASLKDRFLLTWRRIDQILSQNPSLGALGMLWREKGQAEGQNLPSLLVLAEGFSGLIARLEKKIQQ